ncbi:MAG: hypothetical protein HY815_22535 [Candidatus Riflebacteria bacterium]|nr:hypothetical protein [Candidatus Riflebacteria bacterium]
MTLGHRSGLALIRARPLTGRTHQVRIHAARLGCPVLGDRIHGAAPIDAPWPHLMLHARQLTLLHPGTGERLTLDAPRPGCFEAVWQGERDPAELARLAVDDRRAALFFAGTMKSAQLPPVG